MGARIYAVGKCRNDKESHDLGIMEEHKAASVSLQPPFIKILLHSLIGSKVTV